MKGNVSEHQKLKVLFVSYLLVFDMAECSLVLLQYPALVNIEKGGHLTYAK